MDHVPAIVVDLRRRRMPNIQRARQHFNLNYDAANTILNGIMHALYLTAKASVLGDDHANYTGLLDPETSDHIHGVMLEILGRLIGLEDIPLSIVLGKDEAPKGSKFAHIIEIIFGEDKYLKRQTTFARLGLDVDTFRHIFQLSDQLIVKFTNFGDKPAITISLMDGANDIIQYHITFSPRRRYIDERNGQEKVQGYHFSNWFVPDQMFAKRTFYTNDGTKVSKKKAKSIARKEAKIMYNKPVININSSDNNDDEEEEVEEDAISASKVAASAAAEGGSSAASAAADTPLPSDVAVIPKKYSMTGLHFVNGDMLGVYIYNERMVKVGEFIIADVKAIGPDQYEGKVGNLITKKTLLKHNRKPLTFRFTKEEAEKLIKNISEVFPSYVAPVKKTGLTATFDELFKSLNDSEISKLVERFVSLSIIGIDNNSILFKIAQIINSDPKNPINFQVFKILAAIGMDNVNKYRTIVLDYMKFIKTHSEEDIAKKLAELEEEKKSGLNNQSEANLVKHISSLSVELHPLHAANRELFACINKLEGKSEIEAKTALKECFRNFHAVYKLHKDSEDFLTKQIISDLGKMEIINGTTVIGFYNKYKDDFEALDRLKEARDRRLGRSGGAGKKGGARTRRIKRTTNSRWQKKSQKRSQR